MSRREKISKILNLSLDEASLNLRKITELEPEKWSIQFIEHEGKLTLDETKPIICGNLRLFVNDEITEPDYMFPECEILGRFGDDEFAWVCRLQNGGIVEVDEYDLREGKREDDLVFPSISHYLLFIMNYQGCLD